MPQFMNDPNVLQIENLPIRRHGVVAVVRRDQRFLVIRRSAHVTAPRMFCFPGGGIEPGEDEPQALVRELQEELGAVVVPVRRMWHCVTRWNVSLAWWESTLVDHATLSPNPAEVESFHWLTAEEMRSLPNMLESNHWFLQAIEAGEVA
jgi:8-oxo-dGTP diphosphatase